MPTPPALRCSTRKVPALVEIPMTGRLKTKAEALVLRPSPARTWSCTHRARRHPFGGLAREDRSCARNPPQGRRLGRLPVHIPTLEAAVTQDLALTATGSPAARPGREALPAGHHHRRHEGVGRAQGADLRGGAHGTAGRRKDLTEEDMASCSSSLWRAANSAGGSSTATYPGHHRRAGRADHGPGSPH